MASAKFVREYAIATSPVIELMGRANEAFTRAGEIGAKLQFESAEREAKTSVSTYERAQSILEHVPATSDVEQLNNVFAMALRENLFSSKRLLEGIQKRDLDVINRCASLKETSTMFLLQVAEEMNHLVAHMDDEPGKP
jgi:hypothetical protein